MNSGYQGEQDLFVARLCLEVLVRNYKEPSTALARVAQVQDSFKANEFIQTSSLMHFVIVLCEAIRLEAEAAVFKNIIGIYKPQLMRDKLMVEYVDRIAKYFFDTTIKQENPMQAMMKNMMGGGKGPMMMPPMMGGPPK